MIRLYGVLGVLAVLGVLGGGWYVTSLKLDSAKLERDTAQALAEGLAKDLKYEREEINRVNSLLFTLENKEVEIRYVETIVNKEIVKYRDRVVNRCELSADWVCIANAAASGVPADCSPGQVQN